MHEPGEGLRSHNRHHDPSPASLTPSHSLGTLSRRGEGRKQDALAEGNPLMLAVVIARCHARPDHCTAPLSKPISPRGSIACRGAGFTHSLWWRSASPGFSTGWRSRSPGFVRRAESKPVAGIHQHGHRHRRQRLSCRRGIRRAVLRLADRPARPQEALFHHAVGLSHRDRGHRLLVEFMDLRAVSLLHRRGHRRRICRDQFDHPGTGSRALARMDRPLHQRQLLDRRGDRRRRLDRSARSGCHRSGTRLAARLSDRRGARPHHLRHAVLDSGKPALADDPRPRRRSRSDRRRDRGAGPASARQPNRCPRMRLQARTSTPLAR